MGNKESGYSQSARDRIAEIERYKAEGLDKDGNFDPEAWFGDDEEELPQESTIGRDEQITRRAQDILYYKEHPDKFPSKIETNNPSIDPGIPGGGKAVKKAEYMTIQLPGARLKETAVPRNIDSGTPKIVEPKTSSESFRNKVTTTLKYTDIFSKLFSKNDLSKEDFIDFINVVSTQSQRAFFDEIFRKIMLLSGIVVEDEYAYSDTKIIILTQYFGDTDENFEYLYTVPGGFINKSFIKLHGNQLAKLLGITFGKVIS